VHLEQSAPMYSKDHSAWVEVVSSIGRATRNGEHVAVKINAGGEPLQLGGSVPRFRRHCWPVSIGACLSTRHWASKRPESRVSSWRRLGRMRTDDSRLCPLMCPLRWRSLQPRVSASCRCATSGYINGPPTSGMCSELVRHGNLRSRPLHDCSHCG
jgi:hypothetical protein